MMARLSGRFHELSEYYSSEELLKHYLNILNSSLNEGEVLRFHHHTYDYGITVVGYVMHDGEVMLVLLEDDTPLQPHNNVLERLFNSEYGFIEVYKLSRSEFEVDMEVFYNKFLVLGQDFNNNAIRLEIHDLINRVKSKLGIIERPRHTQKPTGTLHSERLVYDEELSEKLKDVTFRASVLLRREYELVEVRINDLINAIYEMLTTRERSVVIVIRINTHSIWIAKQHDNRVGSLPALNTSDLNCNADFLEKLEILIKKLISEHKNIKEIRKARIFIYEL